MSSRMSSRMSSSRRLDAASSYHGAHVVARLSVLIGRTRPGYKHEPDPRSSLILLRGLNGAAVEILVGGTRVLVVALVGHQEDAALAESQAGMQSRRLTSREENREENVLMSANI